MLAVQFLTLVFSAIATVAADADLEAITSNAKLPSPRYFVPAVYDSQDSIYTLGGRGTREIVKYSLSKDQVEVVGQVANTDRGNAVWGGNENIFYFGGNIVNGDEPKSDIWGLNTGNPSNMTVVSNLPEPSVFSASVWDLQDSVYIVGGRGNGTKSALNTILKFSISSYEVEIAAILPSGRYGSTVVWDSTNKAAYIFGGYSSGGYLDEIIKFDPIAGTVIKMNVKLPLATWRSCSVWTGTHAYIIGGYGGAGDRPMVRFTPSTEQVAQIEVRNFPKMMYGFGCAYVEKWDRIYILGGFDQTGGRDEIMFIDLDTQVPTTTTIAPGPGTPVDCTNHLDGTLLSNPYSCESFYRCDEMQAAVLHACQQFLHFNPWTWKCEEPAQVGCGLSYQKPFRVGI